MPDPLHALPYELWTLCIECAIAGRLNGPLDVLMVSRDWNKALLSSPVLWTQIYIENGEDEVARISAFLHLSKESLLHVNVMTALPTVDSLRLVAEHISRVRTISIRPGASDDMTTLHARQWVLAASYILKTLSNGMQLVDTESPLFFGCGLWDDGQWYYHVAFMQFTVEVRVDTTDEPDDIWEDYIARIIPASKQLDFETRAASISSIADLASYVQFHGAIRTAIPHLVKLLESEEAKVGLVTLQVISELGNRVEFREAIASAIPSLVKLLEGNRDGFRLETVQLIGKLANHVELQEAIMVAIPLLFKVLQDNHAKVRLEAVQLTGKLANNAEFREVIASTIPSFINQLLQDNSSKVRLETVKLVGKFTNHIEFREAVATIIPLLIKSLEDTEFYVCVEIVELVEELANRVEFRQAMVSNIPLLVTLLDDRDNYVRLEVVRLVGRLANHAEFRGVIATNFPLLIKLLEDEDGYIRLETVRLVGKLADYVELREGIRMVIPWLMKVLEDGHPKLRLEAVRLVGKFTNHGERKLDTIMHSSFGYEVEFRGAIETSIPLLTKRRGHSWDSIRSEGVRIVGKLIRNQKP